MTYEEVFGIRDNPFCPNKPYEGVSPFLMAKLSSLPLQIHKAPRLKDLFSEDAGPFRDAIQDFQSLLQGYGYDPPGVGTESFVFLIRGPQGTGKTTLALWMVDWLASCLPPPGRWKIYDDWIHKDFVSAEAQASAFLALRDRILQETSETDYICVLLDNLLGGAEQQALNLYGDLFEKRVVAIFLITSDHVLLNKNWDNARFSPHAIYQTEDLSADNAVHYIRDRMKVFRAHGGNSPADLLYPFREDDIRSSLETGADETGRIVTLRQLNITLCNALREGVKLGPPGPPISLVQAYQRLVA